MDTDGGEEAITTSLKRLKLGDPTECQDYVRIKVRRAPVVGQEEPGEEEVRQNKRRWLMTWEWRS